MPKLRAPRADTTNDIYDRMVKEDRARKLIRRVVVIAAFGLGAIVTLGLLSLVLD